MRSLRKRLVVTFTIVAVTASAMVAGIGYQLVRGELLQRAESGAIEDVRDVLDRMTLPIGTSDLLWPNDASVTDDDLADLVESLSGPDRQVVLEYGQEPPRTSNGASLGAEDIPDQLRAAARKRLSYQTLEVDGEPMLLVGTDVERRTGTGATRSTGMSVYVFVSMRNEERVLANLRYALLQAGLLTLVIAATLALLSARQVLLPVRRLGAAARALGAGELDTRLPVHGRDELAELTATFNETAAALEQTVSELRGLEAMSRRFVADVSHELRTPLTTMIAVTDMLSEEAEKLPPDAGQAVDLVLKEIVRLRGLVEHLIEVSRFDSGAAELHRENVDLGEALADCLEVRGWSDQVKLTVPPGLVYSLDPRRFDVIMANLAGNALSHGAPPVLISARVLPSGLEVMVRDHGAGIPREALPHVFDRFFKAGTTRTRSEGSGLGLSIAMANAELHRGTITVKLTEPGTQFTLWVPRP
ncbi:two-component sensor histidine kinase [Acrocarpospora phusangensis]|uniref:histidine kinase n=1 Tax=Acrocarpospora phusangensis TaxID=1070424 RepID=A0A919QMF0_9ACTN|nr:sensor histidine kinase [Acrocarpospora phusangensis]GIH28930.1 two-component sensor histidine kinase [Acrocarpospora phusangensis]